MLSHERRSRTLAIAAFATFVPMATLHCSESAHSPQDTAAIQSDIESEIDAAHESSPDEETIGPNDKFALRGAVQKGPFVVGSTVQVSLLTEEFQPTGTVFPTETTNDLGEFSIDLQNSGRFQLEATGFYYNEITGALSGAPLTLRALFQPSGSATQVAYVNLITHLTKARAQVLIIAGTTFELATQQAERELRIALAITPPQFDPGRPAIASNISGGDDDANAYLLAVSSILTRVAQLRGPGSLDASLQELMNTIGPDLADDGDISAALKIEISAVLATFDPKPVEEALARRLANLGSTATVPDMARVLDHDHDGRADRDDLCPHIATDADHDIDGDGIGDECDPCPQTRCADNEMCVPGDARDPVTADLCIRTCSADHVCGEGEVCAGAGVALDPTRVHCRDDADCANAGATSSHCAADGTCACEIGDNCGALSRSSFGACMCAPTDPNSCGTEAICVPRRDLTTSELGPIFHCATTPTNAPPAIGEVCDDAIDVSCGQGAICVSAGDGAPSTCGKVCRVSPDFSDCDADQICQRLPSPVGATEYGTCVAAQGAPCPTSGSGCPHGYACSDLVGGCTHCCLKQGGLHDSCEQPSFGPCGSGLHCQAPSDPPVVCTNGSCCVPNDCPQSASIAVQEGDEVVPVTSIHLTATVTPASSGSDSLIFDWGATSTPVGSNVTFAPSATVRDPIVELDNVGRYELKSTISKGPDCEPVNATSVVTVVSTDAILIELSWVGDADLDLHFLLEDDGLHTWFDSVFDVYAANPAPNWAGSGTNDDPRLLRQDQTGAGPEMLHLDIPQFNKTYLVGVYAKSGSAAARVRVFIWGQERFSSDEVFLGPAELWDVLSVKWPTEAVTETCGPPTETDACPPKITSDVQPPL